MTVRTPLVWKLFVAVAIVSVGALACTAVYAQSDSYWGTYQGNASHTGYVPVSFDPSTLSLAWHTSLGSLALNPVVEGDGMVLASQARGGLFVLDASTGKEQWTTTFGSAYSVNPPAYANGIVYIQTGKGLPAPPNSPYLYAFNASNGSPVFCSSYSAQWQSYLAPTPYAGNVYVGGGYYGGMYSFNGTSGQSKWFGNVPMYDMWTPAVDGTYAYTYTGSGDITPIKGVFRVLNLSTGATVASVVDPVFQWTGYSMNSAVVLGTNHDAFTINGGRLVCWDTTIDATHSPHIAWSETGNYAGQPTLANGVIYTRSGTTLDALDELTGTLLWQWSPLGGGALTGTMIATESDLFVQTGATTYAVDLTSHQTVWSHQITGPLTLSEGELYVAGSNGTLTAFAVPEPSSFVLLGIVAISLMVCGWWRRWRTV